jgi:hypothetical protein
MFVVSPGKIKQRICHELPRRCRRPETPLDEQGLSLDNATDDSAAESLELSSKESVGSIWDAFLKFYPNYGRQTHADAKLDSLKEIPMMANKDSDLSYVHYPILALNIQASEDPVSEDEEDATTETPSTGRRPRSNSASSATTEGLKKRKSSQIWIN